MSKYNVKHIAARLIAASMAVIITMTALPIETIAAEKEQDNNKYSYDDYSFALHASDGNIVLNEMKADISGDIYASDEIKFTGDSNEFNVRGNQLSDGSCEARDYTDLINASAEYNFTYDTAKSISGSDIDLNRSSFYANGDVELKHTEISGDGNITAHNDITIESAKSSKDNQKVVIMSESGDVTINGSELSMNSAIYAPNGTVTINAKQIDFSGEIYAKQIEINGTSLIINHQDILPDKLVCDAGDDKTIYKNDSVVLDCSCNYEDAKISYTAETAQQDLMSVTAGNTLKPTLKFSKPGEYTVTMHAAINGTTAEDTVNITVKAEPVVNYTTTEDFESGEYQGLDVQNDELKLEKSVSDASAYEKTYNLNQESGIAVTSKQSKTILNPAGDSLDLDYTFKGYGKTEYSSGSDVILLVDNSGSVSGQFGLIKQSAIEILGFMGPKDRFGVSDLGRIKLDLTDNKPELINAVNNCTAGSGSSNFGNGLKLALSMFDENSSGRDKYIFLIADGESSYSDEQVALETAKLAAEKGVRIFSFELGGTPQLSMQDIAVITKGSYKCSPKVEDLSRYMKVLADTVYNLACRNATFTTTIAKSEYLDMTDTENAPDSIKYNDDGSATLSWNYKSIEVDGTENIKIPLKIDMLQSSGYEVLAYDTKLTYYNRLGEGTIINMNDTVVGQNSYVQKGKWSSRVYDSGKDNCTWSLVEWNADYIGNSNINVYLSTSDNGKDFNDRIKVSNGQVLTGLKGRYIKTDIEMVQSQDGNTPVLYDLTIYAEDGIKPSITAEGFRVSLGGVKNTVENKPVAVWIDAKGTYDSISNIEWSVTDDANVSIEKSNELLRYYTFKKPGTYTIKVVVTAAGKKTETAVNVEVAKQDSLTIIDDPTDQTSLKMTVSDTPSYIKVGSPLSFNISFNDTEQLSWYRILYSYGSTTRIITANETDGYKASFNVINSTNEQLVTIQAFDWFGNMCEEKRVFNLDNTPPVISLTASSSYIYCGQSVKITTTAKDEISGLKSVVLTCNGDPVEIDENGEYTFTTENEGSYKFELKATDNANLVSTRSVFVTVREDTVKPTVSLNCNSTIVLGNSMEVSASAKDVQTGIKSFAVKLNGKEIELSEDGKYQFKPTELGEYEFIATAVDNRGNENTVTRTVKCVADTSRPNVSVKLSNPEVVAGEKIIATVTAADNVGVKNIKFYVDGEEKELSEDGTYVYTSDDTNLNSYNYKSVNFKAEAYDDAGNVGSGSAYLKVIKEDTTKPNIYISCSSSYSVNNSNAYMTVTASDNIAVKELKVYVNDELVTFDENNRYYFKTDALYEYNIKAVAADTAGNTNEASKVVKIIDNTRPNITITKDKNSYAMGDTAVLTVSVTDNYCLKSVYADVNGEKLDVDNGSFVCTLSNLTAGSHKLTVKAEDSSGNTYEQSVTITVADTEKPNVSISSAKDKYAKDEAPVITYNISDNVGITKVEAFLNDTPVEYTDGKLALPDKYEPGEYTIKVKAYDDAGNFSEAECSFSVVKSFDTTNPIIGDISFTPAYWEVGVPVSITVEYSDDSENVSLSLYAGEEKLEYDELNNCYIFTPKSVGDATILIHAEDEAGNYTEAEFSRYVYDSLEKHKINVSAEKIVKVNQQTEITLSSTDSYPFVSFKLYCNTTSTEITGENGVFEFTPDKVGEYSFTAEGTDKTGYTDSVIFTIQAASAYEAEVGSKDMEKYLAETPETKLNDQLKTLADSFDSVVDAYSYVTNNISYEAYLNSRRGAVGSYELKRGNDMDQASLLIGLCRYMGVPARYESSTVCLNEEQVKSLFAAQDFESACQLINNSGKSVVINRTEKIAKFDEVRVQVYVPYSMVGVTDEDKKDLGLWVSLDTAIKASELKEYALEENRNPESINELDNIYKKYQDTDIKKFVNDVSKSYDNTDEAYERAVIQKSFTVLPKQFQYEVVAETKNFDAINNSMADMISISVDGDWGETASLGNYKVSDLYGKRVTLSYEGNTGSGTVFEMSASQIAYNYFRPVLSIDGKTVAKGSEMLLGTKHTLYMTIKTGGTSQTITDDLTAGSVYAINLDVGGISDVQLKKAYNEAQEYVNESNASNYYDEQIIGSYLSFAGNLYFAQCDVNNLINAAAKNVEFSSHTKIGVTSYDVRTEENMFGYTSKIANGDFKIDIDYNTVYCVSRTGDTDARNEYMFSSAYMESYYEGFIWEELLLQEGICTTSILDKAMADGDNLVCINAENFDEAIKSVDTTSEEYNEIKSSVNAGYTVIIPDKRVKINEWQGTGYIIADLKDYSHFVFKISGGLNGGGNSKPVDLNLSESIIDSGFSDEFISSAYSLCQSMYYILLEKSISEVASSASAMTAACGAGYGTAIVAGMKLYNDVSGLVDVVNYRVKMLDCFADYCFGEEEKAIDGYIELMIDMIRDLTSCSNDDLVDKALEKFGCSEDGITVHNFVKNIINLIKSYAGGGGD
ncbi:MAG: VWA domain-containing protein [Oscillospiraceae bacterium]